MPASRKASVMWTVVTWTQSYILRKSLLLSVSPLDEKISLQSRAGNKLTTRWKFQQPNYPFSFLCFIYSSFSGHEKIEQGTRSCYELSMMCTRRTAVHLVYQNTICAREHVIHPPACNNATMLTFCKSKVFDEIQKQDQMLRPFLR